MEPILLILFILFVAALFSAGPWPYGQPTLSVVVAILILLHILKKL